MDEIEKKARELLATRYELCGFPRDAAAIRAQSASRDACIAIEVIAEVMRAAPAAPAAAGVPEDFAEFEIHAGGEYFATVGGPRKRAWGEALQYVASLSPGDGAPAVLEVTRRNIPLAARPQGEEVR